MSQQASSEKRDLSQFRDLILDSYMKEENIREIYGSRLPCKERTLKLIEDMRELIFPGFFCRDNLDGAHLTQHLDSLIEGIYDELRWQVILALQTEGMDPEESFAQGEKITTEFLKEIPKIRSLMNGDVIATYDGDPAAKSYREVILAYPGIYAITVYRLAHALTKLGVPLLPRIMTEQAHHRTGIDIHPGATIGPSFFIYHGTGIVIGETCQVGEGVKLYQGVTLGALSTRGGQKLSGIKRHPTIEDQVTIYSGATILGGDTVIGKGATIGGNVFLTESVEPGTIVNIATPELRFVKQDQDTEE